MPDDRPTNLRDRLVAAQARRLGRVTSVRPGVLMARVPEPRVGRCYRIDRGSRPLYAQLVGFEGEECRLLPFSSVRGLEPGASVTATEVGELSPVATDVLGDVIDPLGVSLVDGTAHPCDGGPLDNRPPSPLARQPIERPLPTGVRVIDGLLPLGVGQRVGLFAGSGVGKSTLLAQLAGAAEADVCVLALIGERGREVAEFVDDVLGPERRGRTTVVVATSDAPPLMRMRAAETATAIAEQWRDAGKHCLLLVDSITRYARALREAALLAGEPPARRGYPASVFAELPRLLERAGCGSSGAITAVYTVLVAGGDMEEPVSDEVRGIVDGHWVLSRRLAERGHFPAVDVPASVSRVADRISAPEHRHAARLVRRALSILGQHADAVDLGIYERGTVPLLDAALEHRAALERFLCQGSDECAELAETTRGLRELATGLDIP